MVHLFDFPAQLGNEPNRCAISGFGNIKSIQRQKYIGQPDIETSTHLILLTLKATPPRMLLVGGYICRLWYKGQPLVWNLCDIQGHKSVNCPNKDKCRHFGQSGHFVRSCPSPWGTVLWRESPLSADFPALSDSLASVPSSPPGGSRGSGAGPSGLAFESVSSPSSMSRVVNQT